LLKKRTRPMTKSSPSTTPKRQFEQFVVFSLDNEEYAIPVLSVAEIVPKLEITPFPDAPDYIIGLANLRGKILPVLDLEKRFQLSSNAHKIHKHIIIAENEQAIQFGVLVNQVEDVIKIPSSSIQPSPEILRTKIGAEYLPGVIVLENKKNKLEKARMLLILDMPKVLSDKNIEQLHTLAKTVKRPASKELSKKEVS
jgi:purine-binding chemotaxis protein CheW